MAVKNAVSSEFWSTFVDSIDVFDCRPVWVLWFQNVSLVKAVLHSCIVNNKCKLNLHQIWGKLNCHWFWCKYFYCFKYYVLFNCTHWDLLRQNRSKCLKQYYRKNVGLNLFWWESKCKFTPKRGGSSAATSFGVNFNYLLCAHIPFIIISTHGVYIYISIKDKIVEL